MINNDEKFESLMRRAAEMCAEKEIAEFEALDTTGVTVSDELKQKIFDSIHAESKRRFGGFRIKKRVAAACAAAICAVSVTAVSIRPIRAAVIDAFVTLYEKYLTISISSDDETELPKRIEERILPDLPEGWRIETFDEDEIGGIYEIFGTDGEYIIYDQSIITDSLRKYNSENCVIEKIEITDGVWGYVLTYSYGDIVVHWENGYEFSLLGRDISTEQLIQTALSIINQKK